jgi:16S rRNA (adenine1518-N6/adenine1519-N6)-dimethyltransferase
MLKNYKKNKTTSNGMRAKKSLGQNFLKSNLALKKIIEAGEITNEDIVLEIGPGRGALTEKLLEKAGKVIAVEKDNQLFSLLQEKFVEQINSNSLVLVHDDILNFTEQKFSQSLGDELRSTTPSKKFVPLRYKVIANIPYNITGAILKKFLTDKQQPERMILMVQHEVAKRIIAQDKKESILSISVKAYGEPKMVMKVPARYFSPAPKVDSAVIAIKNISRKIFEENKVDEEKFWEIVKMGFSHKRKKLSGNLKSLVNGQVLEEFGNKRAENLSLLDWIFLSK